MRTYRDAILRSGVPYPYNAMWKLLQDLTVECQGAESPITMLNKYPLFNGYQEDKSAKLEKIQVLAYIFASFSTTIHITASISSYYDVVLEDKQYVSHVPI